MTVPVGAAVGGTRDMHSVTPALPMEVQGWSLFPEDLTGIFLRGKMCCLTGAFEGASTGL